MLDKNINRLESSKGFPYRRIILIITGLLLLLFLILTIVNFNAQEEDSSDCSFFLFIGGNVLVLGILSSLFVPNTYHVILEGDMIRISSRSKSESIPLTSIANIQPGLNHISTWMGSHDIYTIDFREKTKFGKSICFKTNRQSLFDSEYNFGGILKSKWIRMMHANKGYSQSPKSRYKHRRR